MDQLRKRLYDFTDAPPDQVWRAIESALDQEMPLLSKKMAEYTSPPPAHLWKKIQSGMEQPSPPVKLEPFQKRRVIRMLAAAAILFAVFLGIRTVTDFSEEQKISSVPKITTPPPLHSGEKDADTQSTDKRSSVTQPVARSTTRQPAKTKSRSSARYITVSNDEGQTVRLSKKIAPVFNCAGDRVKSIGRRCREDIKALQEKIGSSFTSPTGDFAGLIDMIKSLEDNQ